AGVRQPHEPDVGEQLQAQLQPARLARQPALGKPWRQPRGSGETLVALAARAAARGKRALAVGQQLPAAPRQLAAVLAGHALHLGAWRHPDLERRAGGAVALRALAVPAATGAEVAAAAEGLQ